MRVILCLLKELGLVKETRGARFTLLRRGLQEQELDAIAREYEQRTHGDREKLERMMIYAQSTECRWKLLMDYFESGAEWDGCGACDNCRQPPAEVPLEQPAIHARPRAGVRMSGVPLEAGAMVETRRHGRGEVVSQRGDTVCVRLSSGAVKKFKRGFIRRISAPQPAVA
jgi:ATP-dependent DNA helicase RecQ